MGYESGSMGAVTAVVAPVLTSKVRVPGRRREAVPRPRLVGRVSKAARLTLVSAPAGFGKTTAVIEWLESLPADGSTNRAWVSLDERDDDPTTFWTYVVTAMASTAVRNRAISPLRAGGRRDSRARAHATLGA